MILKYNNIVIIYDLYGIYDMTIMISLMQNKLSERDPQTKNILSPESHILVIGCRYGLFWSERPKNRVLSISGGFGSCIEKKSGSAKARVR